MRCRKDDRGLASTNLRVEVRDAETLVGEVCTSHQSVVGKGENGEKSLLEGFAVKAG